MAKDALTRNDLNMLVMEESYIPTPIFILQ